MSKFDFEFGTAPARTREGSPRKRTEEQVKYDELVVKLVEMWEQAGKPTASGEKPCAFLPVKDEEDYDAKSKMLRSAATLHGVSVRFYDTVETETGWKLPVSAEHKREYKPRTKTANSGE